MRTKNCLTAADAAKIATACETEAQKNNWNVSIVVLDDGGNIMLAHRLDGAPVGSVMIANGKARTAALLRRPSAAAEETIKARPAVVSLVMSMDMIGVQGGVPILYQGECVGAIGVSGVQSHEDEQIAKAGLTAIE